jgi:uncharacterized membrane protein YeaQ/YmgE (transglycosylase-associated protein family)
MVGEVIGAAFVGLIAGFLARALLPGKQSMGFFMTILLGVAGSIVGYFIFAELIGWGDEDKFDLGGLPGAIIGAMLLLFIYERTVGKGGGAPSAGAPSGGGGQGDLSAATHEGRLEEKNREAGN